MAEYAYDPNQVFNIFGLSLDMVRLEWPDDTSSSWPDGYQRYGLKNWTYNHPFSTGTSNSITLGLVLSRVYGQPHLHEDKGWSSR